MLITVPEVHSLEAAAKQVAASFKILQEANNMFSPIVVEDRKSQAKGGRDAMRRCLPHKRYRNAIAAAVPSVMERLEERRFLSGLPTVSIGDAFWWREIQATRRPQSQ